MPWRSSAERAPWVHGGSPGFHPDEGGVSLVVGALLLMVILAGALAVFMVTIIPAMQAQKEYEHMQNVKESFRRLAAIVKDMEVGESRTTDVQMSANPIMYFRSPVRAGTLSIEENGDENHSGLIKFQISNVQYPSQSWFFELGAILCQEGGSSFMVVEPEMIKVEYAGDSNIRLDLNVFKITRIHENRKRLTTSGSGTIEVSVIKEWYKVKPDPETEPNAGWVVINLNSTLEDGSPDEGPDGEVVIDLSSGCTEAWASYLLQMERKLEEHDVVVDPYRLRIFIDGKTRGATKDIYFYYKITELEAIVC